QVVNEILRYFKTPREDGIDYVMRKCFYHNPETGVTSWRTHLIRTLFSAFVVIQQGINLFYQGYSWTIWTGNYERKTSNVQLLYHGAWFYCCSHGAIGTIVIVIIVNITFNSWINQEMEEIESGKAPFEKKLQECVTILYNIR